MPIFSSKKVVVTMSYPIFLFCDKNKVLANIMPWYICCSRKSKVRCKIWQCYQNIHNKIFIKFLKMDLKESAVSPSNTCHRVSITKASM